MRGDTALMKAQGTQLSARELRARVEALVPPTIASIAEMADAVRWSSSDPVVQRRALLLELDTVPVVYRAAFQADPLAAALDLWLFTYQLDACVYAARGACDFGNQQGLAALATRKLRDDLDNEYRRVAARTDAFEKTRSQIERLAAEHPLENQSRIVARYPLSAEVAGTLGSESKDAFSVVGDVEASIEDLSYRLNTYAGDVPMLARWQAELTLGDVLRRPELARAVSNVQNATAAIASALDPARVDAMIEAGFAHIRAERTLALQEVDRQRSLSLEYLRLERQAVLADVARERQALLDQLRQERIESLQEAERLLREAMRRGTERAFEIVDHLMSRLALLLLVGAALATPLAWTALRTLRRPSRASADTRDVTPGRE